MEDEEDMKTRKQSWLLRLFESKLFEPALAINYLFIAKEPGVLEYIGNRLFRKLIYFRATFNRVVCPNLGHTVLTLAFTKYKFLQLKIVLQQL